MCSGAEQWVGSSSVHMGCSEWSAPGQMGCRVSCASQPCLQCSPSWGGRVGGTVGEGQEGLPDPLCWATPRRATHISRTMTILAFSSKASTHWTSLGWCRQFMMLIS